MKVVSIVAAYLFLNNNKTTCTRYIAPFTLCLWCGTHLFNLYFIDIRIGWAESMQFTSDIPEEVIDYTGNLLGVIEGSTTRTVTTTNVKSTKLYRKNIGMGNCVLT